MTNEEIKQWWKERYFEGKDMINVPFGMPSPTIKLHEQWIAEWEKEKQGMDMSYEGIAARYLAHSVGNARSEDDRKLAMEAYGRMIENKPKEEHK